MSHLQVDCFFLSKANHTISNAKCIVMVLQCKNILLIKNIKHVVFDYILPIYFMIHFSHSQILIFCFSQIISLFYNVL